MRYLILALIALSGCGKTTPTATLQQIAVTPISSQACHNLETWDGASIGIQMTVSTLYLTRADIFELGPHGANTLTDASLHTDYCDIQIKNGAVTVTYPKAVTAPTCGWGTCPAQVPPTYMPNSING